MTVIELFAGAGGAALGLRAAGLDSIACAERDPDACETLRRAGFYGLEGDLRDEDWSVYERPDVVWASPPCQAFSTAGKRLGAEDDRNGWPWTLDAVDALRPTWVICENVPGLTQHDADCRNDWQADLPSGRRCAGCYWLQWVLPAFRERFASVQTATLNAADYGVPQTRHRVFLVAGPSPIQWPRPTHGPPSGQLGIFRALKPWVSIADALGLHGTIDGGRNSEANPTKECVRPTTKPCPTVNGKGNQMLVLDHERKGSVSSIHEPSMTMRNGNGAGPTLRQSSLIARPALTVTATEGKGGATDERLASRQLRRRLTVEECAILQDFPPGHPFQGTKSSQYRQVGNAVPPKLAEVVARAVVQAAQEAECAPS